MAGNISRRTIYIEGNPLEYTLERKRVKNLNLRVRRDGSVYASAHPAVPVKQVDAFLISKGDFILRARHKVQEREQRKPRQKQYVSGEVFEILGRGLPLTVRQAERERMYTDGENLFLELKDPLDPVKKEKLAAKFFDQQCMAVFGEILEELYPAVQKYGAAMPALRIRKMDTRWGSCMPGKGVITLNKRLLQAPRACIAYVVMHELCHLVHPNHSKQFYAFLTLQMPDWQERKRMLEESAAGCY